MKDNFTKQLEEMATELATKIKAESPIYTDQECGRQAKEQIINTMKVMGVVMAKMAKEQA